MPEVAGRTVGALGTDIGLGLICRDCGRHAYFTPLGIRTQLKKYRDLQVETFVARCRCLTCGGSNSIGVGAAIEPKHAAKPYVLKRERHGQLKMD